MIGIIILSSLALSARSTITNNNLSKAESLARAQLEYIQSQTYDAAGSYSVLDIPLIAEVSPMWFRWSFL
jgi:hypothetical protein